MSGLNYDNFEKITRFIGNTNIIIKDHETDKIQNLSRPLKRKLNKIRIKPLTSYEKSKRKTMKLIENISHINEKI